MTPVRLEPAAPRSSVKHSTTALPVLTLGVGLGAPGYSGGHGAYQIDGDNE